MNMIATDFVQSRLPRLFAAPPAAKRLPPVAPWVSELLEALEAADFPKQERAPKAG